MLEQLQKEIESKLKVLLECLHILNKEILEIKGIKVEHETSLAELVIKLEYSTMQEQLSHNQADNLRAVLEQIRKEEVAMVSKGNLVRKEGYKAIQYSPTNGLMTNRGQFYPGAKLTEKYNCEECKTFGVFFALGNGFESVCSNCSSVRILPTGQHNRLSISEMIIRPENKNLSDVEEALGEFLDKQEEEEKEEEDEEDEEDEEVNGHYALDEFGERFWVDDNLQEETPVEEVKLKIIGANNLKIIGDGQTVYCCYCLGTRKFLQVSDGLEYCSSCKNPFCAPTLDENEAPGPELKIPNPPSLNKTPIPEEYDSGLRPEIVSITKCKSAARAYMNVKGDDAIGEILRIFNIRTIRGISKLKPVNRQKLYKMVHGHE